MKNDKVKINEYYSQETKDYIQMYKDGYKEYPENLIRLNFIINRLKQNKIKTILDVGCGACGPMIKLLEEGFDVQGFDLSEEMIKEGKIELRKAGHDPLLIFQADLENDKYLPNERFDAIIALGVFPHIVDGKKALCNIKTRLNKKGVVFIQFRNDLFAAYTLNNYSIDFFLNRMIDSSSLPDKVLVEVINFYSKQLGVDKPNKKVRKEKNKILYTDILSKFNNPLNIDEELFEPSGFSIVKIHFYHYHVLPPIFKTKYPKLFRELSIEMENPNDWRGYLMASAYVVEAKRND